ncbi:DUF1801 domain-containing protein [Roseibium sp.]|uniref:DUF1801 domain-containing protein n=1 Tax=Roseibium sp. TaxID=1936156 RepID=UPI003B5177BF
MNEKPALAVIEKYPDAVKSALMELRNLIFEAASEAEGVGNVVETVKWGQLSYLTERPKSGTTIRIDQDTSDQGDIALYVNCQSSLVSEWRGLFPEMTFGGDRSVHLSLAQPLPVPQLRQIILMALTYHSRKKSTRK